MPDKTDKAVRQERVKALADERTDVLMEAIKKRGFTILSDEGYQRLIGRIEELEFELKLHEN